MPEDRRRGKLRQQGAIDLNRLEIDEFETQGFGESFEGVFLGDGPLLDQQLIDTPTVRLRSGGVELIARDKSAFYEKFANIHGQFASREGATPVLES